MPAPPADERARQLALLAQLAREHDELIASLPRHSTSAAMLMRIEDLEEQINRLRAALGVGSEEVTGDE